MRFLFEMVLIVVIFFLALHVMYLKTSPVCDIGLVIVTD